MTDDTALYCTVTYLCTRTIMTANKNRTVEHTAIAMMTYALRPSDVLTDTGRLSGSGYTGGAECSRIEWGE